MLYLCLTRFYCHLNFSCYFIVLFQLLEHFVDEYFDQNPISQMGIIFTKNKRAEKVTELGGMCISSAPFCDSFCTSTVFVCLFFLFAFKSKCGVLVRHAK